MLVAYDLPPVVVSGKHGTDQLGELQLLRAGDLDDTVDRVGHGNLSHRGGHLLGGDRLDIERSNCFAPCTANLIRSNVHWMTGVDRT